MVALGGIAVGVVVAAAALTTALLVMERPAMHHGTVIGVAPWMVVAGLLHVLGAVGSYPRLLRPIVAFPIGPLLVFLLCTVVWVIVRQFATVRNVVPSSGRYLAASGAGTLVVLGAVLFVLTTPTADELLWLVTTPVIAAVVAGISVLALGIFDPTGLSKTRWVGWLVVFGFSTLGTAVAVAIDVFGRSPTAAVDPLIAVGAALPTANVSVAWPLIPMGGILGFLAVSALARIVEREASAGLVLAAALTAATLTPAVALLATVTLR